MGSFHFKNYPLLFDKNSVIQDHADLSKKILTIALFALFALIALNRVDKNVLHKKALKDIVPLWYKRSHHKYRAIASSSYFNLIRLIWN